MHAAAAGGGGQVSDGDGRGGWACVDAVLSCQSAGYVFAAPLAYATDKPLVWLRKADGRPLPGRVARVMYGGSHIDGAARVMYGGSHIDGAAGGPEGGTAGQAAVAPGAEGGGAAREPEGGTAGQAAVATGAERGGADAAPAGGGAGERRAVGAGTDMSNGGHGGAAVAAAGIKCLGGGGGVGPPGRPRCGGR